MQPSNRETQRWAGVPPAIPDGASRYEVGDVPDGARAVDFHAHIEKTAHRLPHWEQQEVACFLTFRLADSLPADKLAQWRHEKGIWMRIHPLPWDESTEVEYQERFPHRIDQWLDQGRGACVLGDPKVARVVGDALEFFNGKRYVLYDYVIMPNHVHLLYQAFEAQSLNKLLHSWRSFTAHKINKMLRRTGTLWQDDYWDRLVRSEAHFRRISDYIAQNPVQAGLAPDSYLYWTWRGNDANQKLPA